MPAHDNPPHKGEAQGLQLGIDLGGTKIEGQVLDPYGRAQAIKRIPTPREDYGGTLAALVGLVSSLEAEVGPVAGIGVAMPGSIAPASGRVQNANSTWLNGRPFGKDLARAVGRPVMLANDADCFALSEAYDGAGQGAESVFGVILGTGCGGGLVVEGALVRGPRAIAGEWGHNPLPWPSEDEYPGTRCWCGRRGCMETWVSGPALARDHHQETGQMMTGEEIARAAQAGDAAARASLDRHAERLARGLAMVVNILDPEVIVLGGGLSRLSHLYSELPDLMRPHVFAEDPWIEVRPPRWGDASGARGAARLVATGVQEDSGQEAVGKDAQQQGAQRQDAQR